MADVVIHFQRRHVLSTAWALIRGWLAAKIAGAERVSIHINGEIDLDSR